MQQKGPFAEDGRGASREAKCKMQKAKGKRQRRIRTSRGRKLQSSDAKEEEEEERRSSRYRIYSVGKVEYSRSNRNQ
jgi:hypothetical protein